MLFCYDEDEEGDLVIVDEIWRQTLDEIMEESKYCWGLPIEICKYIPYDRESRMSNKTVARSKQYAQQYAQQ